MSNGIYAYYDNEKEYIAYVGRDVNIGINKRHNRHLHPSRYNDQQINKALQNNPERYDYIILAKGEFSDKELNEMESQAIELFKTYKYDYPERSVFNFTKGGEGIRGFRHNDETKKKMSKAQKGEKNHNYGKHHSDETKRKMSEAHKGEKHWNYGNPNEYHPTDETKHKQSIANTKKYARIVKNGAMNGKQKYCIRQDCKVLKGSIYLHKLYKWWGLTHPNELLFLEI